MSIPSTEDMTPMQGFASAASGLRIRSLGRGGSFGAAAFVTTCEFLTTISEMCVALKLQFRRRMKSMSTLDISRLFGARIFCLT